MYKVNVNKQFDFKLNDQDGIIKLDKQSLIIDVLDLKSNHFHVLYKNKSYSVEVVSCENKSKNAIIKVNGKTYQTHIEDQYDQVLKELGMENLAGKQITHIKAPMPGLVLNVLVTEGQHLKKGDNLLILEAMKMENMIKSDTEGIVKKIHAIKGDKVEKSQVLIEFL